MSARTIPGANVRVYFRPLRPARFFTPAGIPVHAVTLVSCGARLRGVTDVWLEVSA